MVGAPACGDVMKLQIKSTMKVSLKTRVLKLTAAVLHRFQLPGHRMGEREVSRRSAAIKNTDIAEELELPPVKIHCLFWQKTRSKPPLRTIKANVSKIRVEVWLCRLH